MSGKCVLIARTGSGIGTSNAARFVEELSALLNPSLLALMPKREIRADYFNRYGIKELGTLNGGLCYPNTLLPFGAHLASFGYDEYRESMFRFSVARRLSRLWSLGVSLQYILLQSELFERDMARIAVDVGAAFHPSDDWLITVSVMNLTTDRKSVV